METINKFWAKAKTATKAQFEAELKKHPEVERWFIEYEDGINKDSDYFIGIWLRADSNCFIGDNQQTLDHYWVHKDEGMKRGHAYHAAIQGLKSIRPKEIYN